MEAKGGDTSLRMGGKIPGYIYYLLAQLAGAEQAVQPCLLQPLEEAICGAA